MMGFSIGMTLGGILFPDRLGNQVQGKLTDLRITGSTQGAAIPRVWGVHRVSGNVIWTSSVRETVTQESHGGGGSGGGPSYTTKTYHYEIDLAVLVCEGPITGYRRIWANQDVLYDSRSGSDVWKEKIDPDNVRRYIGTSSQSADSLMQAVLGAGNTPAYRNFAYVVFESLNLDPYGGNVPNFTFEVDGGTCNCQVISEWTSQACGLVSGDYDFSSISGKSFRGFVLPSRTEGRQILENLSQPFMYRNIEVDGKIKSVLRGGSSVLTLDTAYMGAALGNQPTGEHVNESRQQEVELPRTVTINYASESQDFQQFSQQARRLSKHSQQEINLSYDIVITDNQARQIAEALLYLEWVQRMSYDFISGWRYLMIAPADIVTIPTILGNRTTEILDISAGLFGPVSFRLIDDFAYIYTQTASGQGGNSNNTVDPNELPKASVYDTNAIFDADSDFIGYYAACSSPAVQWPGAIIFTDVKIKNSNGYLTGSPFSFDASSTHGETLSTLADGPPARWDEVNTVDIELYVGTVSTAATDLDVLNGSNMIVIGYEILQFRTATSIGTNQWRLSGLIRGRRGTEYATTTHSTGERVALVNNRSKRFNAHRNELGKTFGFRPIENNRSYTTLPSFDNVQLVGRSRMPYAPCKVTGVRDGSLNLTISWVRRVRQDGDLVDNYDAPLDEMSEKYDIEIYADGSYGVIKRTFTGNTDTDVVYSAANQVTDFGSEQSTVYCIIYQYSDTIAKRGFGAKAAV